MPIRVIPQNSSNSPPTPTNRETIANFVMPNAGGNVSVNVSSSSGIAPGQTIYIDNAGYFTISSIDDSEHITITNTGAVTNSPPTTLISSGQAITIEDNSGTVLVNGRVIFASNLTDYPVHAAISNPATNVPAIAPQSVQIGGTVASPETANALVKLYPRDPTKGPFGLFFQGSAFSGVWDDRFAFGYNWQGENSAEPRAAFAIENDYLTSGVHEMEAYQEWKKPNNDVVCRPFYSVMNRASYAVSTLLAFGSVAGDALQITDGTGTPQSSWSTTSIDIGVLSKPITITGLRLTGTFSASTTINVTNAFLNLIAGQGGGSPVHRQIYLDAAQVIMRTVDGATSAKFGDGAGNQQVILNDNVGAKRFSTENAQVTITGALSAVIDPAVKTLLTKIIQALSTGSFIAVDSTS